MVATPPLSYSTWWWGGVDFRMGFVWVATISLKEWKLLFSACQDRACPSRFCRNDTCWPPGSQWSCSTWQGHTTMFIVQKGTSQQELWPCPKTYLQQRELFPLCWDSSISHLSLRSDKIFFFLFKVSSIYFCSQGSSGSLLLMLHSIEYQEPRVRARQAEQWHHWSGAQKLRQQVRDRIRW